MDAIALNRIIIRESKKGLTAEWILSIGHWLGRQQGDRLFWLGLTLAAHGCLLLPVTAVAVMLSGNNIFLYMLAGLGMTATLVPNLAAMPTKVTIPIFGLSVLLDGLILGDSLVKGLHFSNIF